jgi:hypothetical protein
LQAPKKIAPGNGDREGWERFERAVDAAVKSGPKHQAGSSPSKEGKPLKPKKEK